MELFYYCLSAPKEEQTQRTHYYVPASPDPIVYDDVPKTLEPEEEEEVEPLTYTDLNESLHEVDGEKELVEDEGELSPVEESAVPLYLEPENVNLLQRHNSRKFKTPSFKWKKKKKKNVPVPEPEPVPSAPDETVAEDLVDLTVDDNVEEPGEEEPVEEEADEEVPEPEISVDSLNDKLKENDEEANVTAAQNVAEAERLQHDVEFFKDRLREAEELLNRYKTDNIMLHQRVELAERDRGALQHGNHLELEKVREDYQTKLNELSHYPEKLSSAEARCQHAEAETESLRSQLADKHRSVEELNKKIDLFQETIGKLKEKVHAVNEDNIELSNKTQSHERKVIEADLHNKNLMDLVSKKEEAVEHHQPLVDVESKLEELPPPPASPSTDNNVSEEEKVAAKAGSDTETGSSDDSESEEDVDWSEMLKSAEANRERLGLDNISDGESSQDEDGNRIVRKKEVNGLTTQDLMNRMATNQLMGYDEFGRPMNGKYNGSMMSGGKGARNRALLFGMDGGKKHKSGSNNRSAGKKDRSGRSGGRRAKKGGANMALLGF